MSYKAALAEAKKLKYFLEQQKVDVSIELVIGTRAQYGWLVPPGKFVLEMSHHIVSSKVQGLTPFLKLVKVGRPDVPGPLCNGYGGFDERYRIITMGVANHSGAGGPLKINNFYIPANAAAYVAWGTEYEGGISEADWTRSFRLFMGASNAGIIDYLRSNNKGVTDWSHLEHSTWTSRKTDRKLYSRQKGIAEIAAWRAGASVYTTEEVKELQTLLNKVMGTNLLVDGDLGPYTRAVVRDFQEKYGLFIDGDPGPITMGALRKAAESTSELGLGMYLFRGNGSPKVYALLPDGTKRHILTPAHLSALGQVTGAKVKTIEQKQADSIPLTETSAPVFDVDMGKVSAAAEAGARKATGDALKSVDVTVGLKQVD